MEEYTKSVKAVLYDRAKKPFTGTFILAWIICNWKFLVALFFINEERLGEGITRIEYIQNQSLLTTRNLFWTPLLYTIGGLIFFSIFNYWTLLFLKIWKDLQFTKIDKKTKVDATDYAELLDEFTNSKSTFAKQIDSLNKEKTLLQAETIKQKERIKVLEEDSKSYQQSKSKLSTQNNEYINQIREREETIDQVYEILKAYINRFGSITRRSTGNSVNNEAPSIKKIQDKIAFIKNFFNHYRDN